ncbi:hypothetical protein D088_300008 [Salmonella enterica subsp. houtenae serovar 16:z4,z32:-- str. RKS3027]|nr:hypothetical protein D088_300008 [Salmonella enterica subsp. houtenae serovar 16:z4,z32:-- str. RKS3027]
MHHLAMPVGKGIAFLFKVTKAIQQFTHDISPASINFPPSCRFGVEPLPDGRSTGAYVVIVV